MWKKRKITTFECSDSNRTADNDCPKPKRWTYHPKAWQITRTHPCWSAGAPDAPGLPAWLHVLCTRRRISASQQPVPKEGKGKYLLLPGTGFYPPIHLRILMRSLMWRCFHQAHFWCLEQLGDYPLPIIHWPQLLITIKPLWALFLEAFLDRAGQTGQCLQSTCSQEVRSSAEPGLLTWWTKEFADKPDCGCTSTAGLHCSAGPREPDDPKPRIPLQ